ncbi:MAG: sulfotransferase [Synechococcaceae cyanobacterium SM2_3_1]|nr:sulfotransferase [Synechococcaceae cyanobacterium SM2_3_1]
MNIIHTMSSPTQPMKSYLTIKKNLANRFRRLPHAPVIVLGNQKSGTTAIACLLGKACQQVTTIDPFFRIDNSIELRRQLFARETSFDKIINQYKSYFHGQIIKDPNFSFFYPDLKKAFPESKFIFILRDPRDNIRSILNRLKLPGNMKHLDPTLLLSFQNTGWQYVIEGRLPDMEGETYIEKLAHRWNCVTNQFLKHRENLTLIRYEDFVHDKVSSITQLAKQVELLPQQDISQEVNVQFQPRGNPNIKWIDFFGYDNLKLIELICAEQMIRFNYMPTI